MDATRAPGSIRSSEPIAATRAFSSEANTTPSPARQEVQRLDAERVPGQDEFTGALVEQREREHAAEPAQRVRAPGPPGLQDHLGVRLGGEADAAGDQLGPQRPVVVQLAVVDEGQAVLGQRLVGRGAEVDDRKPAVAELHGHPAVLVTPRPRRVRTAVGDPVGHDVDELVAVGLLVAPCDPAHVSPRPRRSPSAAAQLPVDVEVGAPLVAPGQFLLDPGPAPLAHLQAPALVVDQRHDGLGVLVHVVGRHVHGGVAGRHPRLAQVEGDHGQLEGHVLHGLVHGRHVVERILGVRRQADVRGRHDPPDQLVGRPAGELHVPGQAQLVAQGDQVVEAVPGADQREGDVVAPELVDHDVGGPHHDVDSVLRAHDADVGGQEPCGPGAAPGSARRAAGARDRGRSGRP